MAVNDYNCRLWGRPEQQYVRHWNEVVWPECTSAADRHKNGYGLS
jgi:hypothetical protein